MSANTETADLISRKEAARYLARIGCPLAPQTLANMASNNNKLDGPPYIRNGWKSVLYRKCELDAWAAARRKEICRR